MSFTSLQQIIQEVQKLKQSVDHLANNLHAVIQNLKKENQNKRLLEAKTKTSSKQQNHILLQCELYKNVLDDKSRNWTCDVCSKTMLLSQRKDHMKSNKHQKRQKLEHLYYYHHILPKLNVLLEKKKRSKNPITKNRISSYIQQKGLCFCCNALMWEKSIGYKTLQQYIGSCESDVKVDWTKRECTAEHVRPKHLNGNNTGYNIVATCKDCNHLRGKNIQFPIKNCHTNPVPPSFSFIESCKIIKKSNYANENDYKYAVYIRLKHNY